jgi:O-antigen ligase
VRQAPLFGHGGGTYLPDYLHVTDDQFLKTAVELGLVGVVVLAVLFLYPTLAALVARGQTDDEALRLLLGVLAGAALAAGVCSVGFDSLSFPMFYNTFALVLGLIGACCRLAMGGETFAQKRRRAAHQPLPGLNRAGFNYGSAPTEGA